MTRTLISLYLQLLLRLSLIITFSTSMLVLVLLFRDVLKEAHLLSGVNRKVFVFHEGRAVFIHSLASSAA